MTVAARISDVINSFSVSFLLCSFIFTKVMTEIEPFYRIHDLHPTATGYFPLTQQSTVSAAELVHVYHFRLMINFLSVFSRMVK